MLGAQLGLVRMLRLLLHEGWQHVRSYCDPEASCLLGDTLWSPGTKDALVYSHQSPGDPESNNPALNSTLGPNDSSVERHTGEGSQGSPVHREGEVGSSVISLKSTSELVRGLRQALGPLLPTLPSWFPNLREKVAGGIQMTLPKSDRDQI